MSSDIKTELYVRSKRLIAHVRSVYGAKSPELKDLTGRTL